MCLSAPSGLFWHCLRVECCRTGAIAIQSAAGSVQTKRGELSQYVSALRRHPTVHTAGSSGHRQTVRHAGSGAEEEALNNASKHSGVKRVEVQLAANAREIHLAVRDSGKGFDIEAARQKRGLGLMSMRERVRLVGGTIVIDSKPLAGTTIRVCVPLGKERDYKTNRASCSQ